MEQKKIKCECAGETPEYMIRLCGLSVKDDEIIMDTKGKYVMTSLRCLECGGVKKYILGVDPGDAVETKPGVTEGSVPIESIKVYWEALGEALFKKPEDKPGGMLPDDEVGERVAAKVADMFRAWFQAYGDKEHRLPYWHTVIDAYQYDFAGPMNRLDGTEQGRFRKLHWILEEDNSLELYVYLYPTVGIKSFTINPDGSWTKMYEEEAVK